MLHRAERPSALDRLLQRRSTVPDARFLPLPEPLGEPPYRLALQDVVGPVQTPFRFHCVGDTGGHLDPRPQRRVVAAMAAELAQPDPPRFFYHLGDVVYPHGEADHYRAQFDVPYADYGAPIFAVPGNHDSENGLLSGERALGPFSAHFCSGTVPLHEAREAVRRAPRQPHVFWTLVHPQLRIVGLWGNQPEGGQFATDQVEWLVGELRDTPPGAVLIIAVHQPVYSADVTHGSNLELVDLLDGCCERAGRAVDAVFCGHAHVYERFTRRVDGREIPYVVAGAGGYPELHPVGHGVGRLPASFPALPGVTLDAVEDRAHGFMTVTVGSGGAQVAYTTAGPDGPAVADRFCITPAGSVSR